jgi:hypothetical protein
VSTPVGERRVDAGSTPSQRLGQWLSGPTALEWVPLLVIVYLMVPSQSLVPSPGLDSSWPAGLAIARREELPVGPHLVFTYGPWGWLNHPMALSRADLLLASAFGVLGVSLAWVALRRALRRGLPPVWAAVTAAVLVLVMTPINAASIPFFVGVVTLVLLHIVEQRPFSLAATVGLPAAAALLLQLKFSEGTVLTVVVALGCLISARPLWRLLVAAGSYVATTVVAWVAVGGSLGELPRWLALSFDEARYYGDAMGLEDEPNTFPYVVITVTFVVTALLVVVAFRGLPRLSFVVLMLACLAVLFLGFREETTRHNFGRTSFFEFAIPVFALTVQYWRWRAAALLVLGFAVLMGNNHRSFLDADRARLQAASTLEVLVDTDYQAQLLESGRQAGRDQYALPPELVEAVGSHPLSVDGYEIALPWYYEEHWSPLPVLQSYAAYSDALADVETDWLAGRPQGHRILRPVTTGIDGRNSLWDPPAYVLAELCSTRPVASTDAWLLLAKSDDRCAEPRTVTTTHLDAHDVLDLPEPGPDRIVTVSVDADAPGLLVRLGRLVDKSARPLTVEVDGSQPFRLPRALADGPLVVQVPDALGWPAQFGGGTAYRTISFSEPGTVRVQVVDVE